MVERPERHVGDIARAGADSITIHVEATPHVHYTLASIREAGCTRRRRDLPRDAGRRCAEVAAETLDLALCMSVNPGWGAQTFIPHSLRQAARGCGRAAPSEVALEVDGGVNEQTAGPCVAGRRQPAGDRLGGVRLRRPGGGLRGDRRRRRARLA